MSLNEGNKTTGLKGKICKNDSSPIYIHSALKNSEDSEIVIVGVV